jgi:hypothetical protein
MSLRLTSLRGKNQRKVSRWFEAVNDLESATIRIEELIALSPGESVVVDQRTRSVIPADRSSFRFDARRE